jgi:hypothetical protein
MALINEITFQELRVEATHKQADCTFSIVGGVGEKHLQLDTYGSKGRKILGKKSQSIRLTPSAISNLKRIIKEYNL